MVPSLFVVGFFGWVGWTRSGAVEGVEEDDLDACGVEQVDARLDVAQARGNGHPLREVVIACVEEDDLGGVVNNVGLDAGENCCRRVAIDTLIDDNGVAHIGIGIAPPMPLVVAVVLVGGDDGGECRGSVAVAISYGLDVRRCDLNVVERDVRACTLRAEHDVAPMPRCRDVGTEAPPIGILEAQDGACVAAVE